MLMDFTVIASHATWCLSPSSLPPSTRSLVTGPRKLPKLSPRCSASPILSGVSFEHRIVCILVQARCYTVLSVLNVAPAPSITKCPRSGPLPFHSSDILDLSIHEMSQMHTIGARVSFAQVTKVTHESCQNSRAKYSMGHKRTYTASHDYLFNQSTSAAD